MKILITGTAGFIGFHLARFLVQRGDEVVGIDNINDYYDVNLKYGRLKETGIDPNLIEINKPVKSSIYPNYTFIKLDLTDSTALFDLFQKEKFTIVCNLAAQAGVRYSLENPQAYVGSNIQGFLNILEGCRQNNIQHLLYASSSSVYGLNKEMPFSVDHNVDHPISLYAASKKSNELMAHSYSHLFNIPTTGLRFFTVYGPWGRPDMALFLFTKAIVDGKPIKLFNNGVMKRDFTYIDDIVAGMVKIIDKPFTNKLDETPYRIFNIGKGSPVGLNDFISEIERSLGMKAVKEMLPMQDGDVSETWADIKALEQQFDFKPSVGIEQGVDKFIDWYRMFYADSFVKELQ